MRIATEPGLSHEMLARVARDLTDNGMLIEAGFVGLRLACLLPDMSAVELHERRMMFFAGAQHLFSSLMSILDPDAEVTDADMGRMGKINEELKDFELRYLPTDGSV